MLTTSPHWPATPDMYIGFRTDVGGFAREDLFDQGALQMGTAIAGTISVPSNATARPGSIHLGVAG